MSKKIARFSKKLADILDEKEAELHWEPNDSFRLRNRLLPACISAGRIPDIKTISVRCVPYYVPDSKTARLDNGGLPIFVEVTDDAVSIIGVADYIEWCNEANKFFYSLEHVEHISLHDIDFKDIHSIDGLFNADKKLKDVNFKNLINTESIYSMQDMFAGCENIEEIDMSIFHSEWKHVSSAFTGCFSLKTVKGMHITHACDSLSRMFMGCESLKVIEGISDWDVSSVINTDRMFIYCKSIESLDLTGWNTESLESGYSMFNSCSRLNEVRGIGNWNVVSLKLTDAMFASCVSLESLDLSKWNTKSLRETESMFCGCEVIKSINLHGWKTSRVKSMAFMFENCRALEDIDISTFRTGAVIKLGSMFKNCESLKALDLSKFTLNKCMDVVTMFYGCRNLSILDLTGWKLNGYCRKELALNGCDSLVFVDTSVFK